MEDKQEKIAPETEELLKKYIRAFCNLYGITPVYRAWRIISKQNPGLGISREQFLAFLDGMVEEEMLCIVVGQEDIYEGIEEKTPPLRREILAQHLYLVDGFDSYENLLKEQDEKPFYVPEKDELLKYADDSYVEETREYRVLKDFLQGKFRREVADGLAEDLYGMAAIEEMDTDSILAELDRLTRKGRKLNPQEEDEFLCHALDMCESVRSCAHRGHTGREIRIILGAVGPDEFMSVPPEA